MTEGKLIERVADKALQGIRSQEEIEEDMVLSTLNAPNWVRDNNIRIIDDIYEEEFKIKGGIPEYADIKESVEMYNSDRMDEMAMILVVQGYQDDGIDIEDVSEEKFDEDLAEQENSNLDYYSYNGMLDEANEILAYVRAKGCSLMVSKHTEEYDNFTWGIEMSEESQLDVIVNGPQIPMFSELITDECENNFCKYGNFFLDVSEAV